MDIFKDLGAKEEIPSLRFYLPVAAMSPLSGLFPVDLWPFYCIANDTQLLKTLLWDCDIISPFPKGKTI